MNKRKLTNEELDGVGRDLVRAAAVSRDEIENIVLSPMLFSSIKRRIETERPWQEKTGPFEYWRRLSLLSWNRAAAAAAAAVIFLAATVAILVLAKRNQNISNGEQIAGVERQGGPAVNPPAPDRAPPAPEVPEPVRNTAAVSYKKEPVRAQKTVTHRAAKQMPVPVFEAEGDFYPVAGTPGGMPQDGHIVRAEIPRSSFFAMGVDLPIEGGNEKIKTDLLVGSDGVVRGIRIVK